MKFYYLLLVLSTLIYGKVESPNIIFLVTDDQGWGDVGYNGHPIIKTPHLDKMAKEAVRLDRFYATSSVCSPSRASCLTGRNNWRLGISTPANHNWHLNAKEITIAEAVKANGYKTAHFGKWHIGGFTEEKSPGHKMTPGMAGFDYWFSTPNVLPTYDPYKKGYKSGKYEMYWENGRNITLEEGRKRSDLKGDDAKFLMDKAILYMEERVEAKEKFLIYFCFHNVHTPLGTIPEFSEQYNDVKDSVVYSSNVSAVDAQVGRMRAELRRLGIAENTMLWFTSDNGPNLKGKKSIRHGEAQGGKFNYTPIGSTGAYRGYKRSLYEGGVRVPGLVEWPALIKKPFVSSYSCNMVDWFPTVMDALEIGLPSDREIDGISLIPFFKSGGEMKQRGEAMGFFCQGWAAWSADRYKIVRVSKKGKWEMYDLKEDPFEENDIANQMPEKFNQLKKEFDTWGASCETDMVKVVNEYKEITKDLSKKSK